MDAGAVLGFENGAERDVPTKMESRMPRNLGARVWLAGFLVAGTLAALLPGGAAQQLGSGLRVEGRLLDTIGPEGRLMPESEVAEIQFSTRVSFPPGSVCVSSYQLIYTAVSMVGYATATVHPASDSGQVPPEAVAISPYERTHVARMFVSTTRDAPAMKDEVYKLKVTLQTPPASTGCTVGGAVAEGSILIKNDYVPLLQLTSDALVREGASGAFLVDATNLGNGPTRVNVDLTPTHAGSFGHLSADAALLESRAQKGNEAVYKAVIRIEYAVTVDSVQSFAARFVAGYDGAAEGTLTDETSILFSVDPGGVVAQSVSPEEDPAATVPGADALTLLVSVAVGAALFLVRRRV